MTGAMHAGRKSSCREGLRDAQNLGGVPAMTTLRIAEIFGPTIQGEGALIGEPTVFVRAGGCDYRCSWCDSMHAVDSANRHDWAVMAPEEVMSEVTPPVRRQAADRLDLRRQPGNPGLCPGDRLRQG